MEKRILITGASSGIGREAAKIFIAKGYVVGLAARRLEALEELRTLAPDRVFCRQIDVCSAEAPAALLALLDDMGDAGIIFHCAGIGKQNPPLDLGLEQSIASTNVAGFINIVDTAFNYFKTRGGGHIAAISSIAGTKGLGAAPAYSATKRFQANYLQALAQLSRMQGLGISFTDIRPGFVDTALLSDGKTYPMLMRPEKVATAAVRAIERRRRVRTIDFRYRLLVFFWRLVPGWLWERMVIRN